MPLVESSCSGRGRRSLRRFSAPGCPVSSRRGRVGSGRPACPRRFARPVSCHRSRIWAWCPCERWASRCGSPSRPGDRSLGKPHNAGPLVVPIRAPENCLGWHETANEVSGPNPVRVSAGRYSAIFAPGRRCRTVRVIPRLAPQADRGPPSRRKVLGCATRRAFEEQPPGRAPPCPVTPDPSLLRPGSSLDGRRSGSARGGLIVHSALSERHDVVDLIR